MTPVTPPSRRPAALLGLVLALAALCFAPSLGHDFVHFDDNINLYENPHLQGLDAGTLRWLATDTTYARRYMPLGWLSYAVDREFFGLSPRSYHVGNWLLHLAGTALVFLLLRQLLQLADGTGGRREARPHHELWAAAGALLWALHPLRVETVAWASARIYGVTTVLILLWLHAWLRAREPDLTPARRRTWQGIALGAYAASLLTYPLALFAPALLFALDVFPLRRAGARLRDWVGPGTAPRWQDKWPFLLMAALGLGLTLWARGSGGAYNALVTLDQFSLGDRLGRAVYVWAYYLWKPWAPLDLSPVYPSLRGLSLLATPVLASAALLAAISLILFRLRTRQPGLWMFWLAYLALLVPFLGLSEYTYSPADRYSGLSGLLWAALLALGLRQAHRQGFQPVLVRTLPAALVAACGLLTWQQTAVWRNTITLHRHLVARLGEDPQRARFDEVLAIHSLRAGFTNEALTSFTNAIRYEQVRPDRHVLNEGVLPRSHAALGDLHADLGDTAAATTHYRAALAADPGYSVAHVNLGILLAQTGQLSEAAECFRNALRLRPDHRSARHNLTLTLRRLGQETTGGISELTGE